MELTKVTQNNWAAGTSSGNTQNLLNRKQAGVGAGLSGKATASQSTGQLLQDTLQNNATKTGWLGASLNQQTSKATGTLKPVLNAKKQSGSWQSGSFTNPTSFSYVNASPGQQSTSQIVNSFIAGKTGNTPWDIKSANQAYTSQQGFTGTGLSRWVNITA